MEKKLKYILSMSFIFIAAGALAQTKDVYEMSLEELMNTVVVSSSKSEEKASEIPASVVTISRKQIELYGYKSLPEILQSVTGLYLVEQYNWSGMTGLGVRGYFTEGSFSNLVIMIDGSPVLREGYINQFILSRLDLPVEAIDRIEIIRGPMSVMYGENAFFGAINIITLQKDKKTTDNLFALKLGLPGNREVALRTEHRQEDFKVAFNLTGKDNFGLNVPYTELTSNPVNPLSGKTYLESVGLNNNSTTGGQLAQRGVFANAVCFYKTLKISIGHAFSEKGFFWRAPSHHAKGSNLLINASDIHLEFTHYLNNRLKLKTKASYASYNSTSRYRLFEDDFWGHSVIYSSIINSGADLIYNSLNKKNQFQTGFMYDGMLRAGDDVDIPSINNIGNSSWKLKDGNAINKYQLYGQVRRILFNKLHLIAGFRVLRFSDYTYQRLANKGTPDFILKEKNYRDDEFYHTYRLAGLYKINHNNILKLMYGTAVTVPNIRQNTTHIDYALGHPGINIDLIPQLKPALIETFELQYNALFSDKFIVNLSLFSNNLSNLIESSGLTLTDGSYVVVTQNSGKILTTGLELGIKARAFEGFELNTSFSFQNTQNLKEGYENIQLGYTPKFLAYLKASYFFTEKISLAVNSFYVSKMKTGLKSTDENQRVGMEAPAYYNLNANLHFENIKNTKFYASLYSSNLLNTEIRYAVDPANSWADKGFRGRSRQVIFTLGYKF